MLLPFWGVDQKHAVQWTVGPPQFLGIRFNWIEHVTTGRSRTEYDAHHPGTVFSDGLRLALDDAWRLQAAVARLCVQRGEAVIGYKIGCVSEGN